MDILTILKRLGAAEACIHAIKTELLSEIETKEMPSVEISDATLGKAILEKLGDFENKESVTSLRIYRRYFTNEGFKHVYIPNKGHKVIIEALNDEMQIVASFELYWKKIKELHKQLIARGYFEKDETTWVPKKLILELEDE